MKLLLLLRQIQESFFFLLQLCHDGIYVMLVVLYFLFFYQGQMLIVRLQYSINQVRFTMYADAGRCVLFFLVFFIWIYTDEFVSLFSCHLIIWLKFMQFSVLEMRTNLLYVSKIWTLRASILPWFLYGSRIHLRERTQKEIFWPNYLSTLWNLSMALWIKTSSSKGKIYLTI